MTPKVAGEMKQATRARPGQPTKRTPEVVDEILDRIACGEALVNICQDDHLPGYSTFNRWQREDRDLLEQVDIAYEFHARTLDDIADNWLAGGPGSTGDFRRDEARVGHLRYRLGKLNRRRFGDRQQVDLNSTINVSVPSWAARLPGQSVDAIEHVEDGQLLDPDAVYERETVNRLTEQRSADDTPKPD